MKLTDYIAGTIVLIAGIFLLNTDMWLGGLLLVLIGAGQILITRYR